VPALLRLFDEYKVRASFFFATGKDKSGRRTGHTLQPWYPDLELISRLYGIALPPPLIHRQVVDAMRSAKSSGHETGILCHDRSRWLDNLAHADAGWTWQELNRSIEAYAGVMVEKPQCMAAEQTGAIYYAMQSVVLNLKKSVDRSILLLICCAYRKSVR
jgi:hypothetical protein